MAFVEVRVSKQIARRRLAVPLLLVIWAFEEMKFNEIFFCQSVLIRQSRILCKIGAGPAVGRIFFMRIGYEIYSNKVYEARRLTSPFTNSSLAENLDRGRTPRSKILILSATGNDLNQSQMCLLF